MENFTLPVFNGTLAATPIIDQQAAFGAIRVDDGDWEEEELTQEEIWAEEAREAKEREAKEQKEKEAKQKTTSSKRLTPKASVETNMWDIYRKEFLQKVEFDPSTQAQQEAVLNQFNEICKQVADDDYAQADRISTMLGSARRIIFVESTAGKNYGLVSYYDTTRSTLQISSNFAKNKIYLSPQSLRENAYMADSLENGRVPEASFLATCQKGVDRLLKKSQECLNGLRRDCKQVFSLSENHPETQHDSLESITPSPLSEALRELRVGQTGEAVSNSVTYKITRNSEREGSAKPQSLLTKSGEKDLTKPQKKLANFQSHLGKTNERMSTADESLKEEGMKEEGQLFGGLGIARLNKAEREAACGSSTIPMQAAKVSEMFQGRQ